MWRGGPICASENSSFIALVRLKDYADFISDCNGKLDPSLFEANVRDWEGKNKVNLQIRQSLDVAPVDDFWWLNNGVTILATDANYNGNYIQMKNPEIVNGLQTSRTVHEYFTTAPKSPSDQRRLLVRIIVLSDDDEIDSRREVITATNSHTAVKVAELRSLEKIHFDIETVLSSHDPPVYYERRKKYYRNVRPRIPVNQIVSVTRLTQSVIATLLCQPDDAKARPSDYLQIDSQDKYERVFNPDYPLELYYFSALLFVKVDRFMKNDERYSRHSRNVRLSLRYHVMTHLALMYGDPKRDGLRKRASRIAELDVSGIQDYLISDSVSIVLQLYLRINRRPGKFPWKTFESELIKEIDDFKRQQLTAESDSATQEMQDNL